MTKIIAEDTLITNLSDALTFIVETTYPYILQNKFDPTYFQDKIIDMLSDYMLKLIPEEAKTYLSSDSPCTMNEDVDNSGMCKLYVVLPKVINYSNFKILICDNNKKISYTTSNVIYKEVFGNL
ncbi:hypothetical protein CR513_57031, partial [Mucuna pruriens]